MKYTRINDEHSAKVEAMLTAGGSHRIETWATDRGHSIIMAREPVNDGRSVPDLRWHLSIRGPSDVPVWSDLVAIGHKLRPGVCFVVGVPPESWWINVHPHVLHLWELKDANLLEAWRGEAQGHRPT